jgi:hypothetical protein
MVGGRIAGCHGPVRIVHMRGGCATQPDFVPTPMLRGAVSTAWPVRPERPRSSVLRVGS